MDAVGAADAGGLLEFERTALEDQRQKGRMDLAKLTGAQRKKQMLAAHIAVAESSCKKCRISNNLLGISVKYRPFYAHRPQFHSKA